MEELGEISTALHCSPLDVYRFLGRTPDMSIHALYAFVIEEGKHVDMFADERVEEGKSDGNV